MRALPIELFKCVPILNSGNTCITQENSLFVILVHVAWLLQPHQSSDSYHFDTYDHLRLRKHFPEIVHEKYLIINSSCTLVHAYPCFNYTYWLYNGVVGTTASSMFILSDCCCRIDTISSISLFFWVSIAISFETSAWNKVLSQSHNITEVFSRFKLTFSNNCSIQLISLSLVELQLLLKLLKLENSLIS